MIALIMLIIGGGVGWFSYRYPSAFFDMATVVAAVIAIPASRNVPFVLMSQKITTEVDPDGADRLDAFVAMALPLAMSGL